jgi:hypothetical protein
MEHPALVPTFGVLLAALTSAWIGTQASGGDPSDIREGDQANIEITLNESAEARVTIVPKKVSLTRPDGLQEGYLGIGFGITVAPLDPLPLSGEYIPSLMVMASPSPLAATTPAPTVAVPRALTPKAKPAPTVAVPRAVTPKAKPKPTAQQPQERLSWLRLPWW